MSAFVTSLNMTSPLATAMKDIQSDFQLAIRKLDETARLQALSEVDKMLSEKVAALIEQAYITQAIESFLDSDSPTRDHEAYDRVCEICSYHLAVVISDYLIKKYPGVALDSDYLCDVVLTCDPRKRATATSELMTSYFTSMAEAGYKFDQMLGYRIDRLFGEHTDYQHIDFGDETAQDMKYAPVGSIVVIPDDSDQPIQVIDDMPREIDDDKDYLRVTGAGLFTTKLEPAYDEDASWSGPYENGKVGWGSCHNSCDEHSHNEYSDGENYEGSYYEGSYYDEFSDEYYSYDSEDVDELHEKKMREKKEKMHTDVIDEHHAASKLQNIVAPVPVSSGTH